MKLASYWLDTAPEFSQAATGPVEGRFDVVVIGAGYTGLSAALALAKRGASVGVLEANCVVGEASGRNGGHCNNGLPHDYTGLMRRFGRDGARKYYQAFNVAVDTVERIAREEQIDCDFRRTGRLKLAAKPGHYEQLARSCELLHAEADSEVELVSPADIRREVASRLFHGGLLQKTSAQLHVGRFGIGLAEAAARRGARIFESAAVTSLQRQPTRAGASGDWQLTTARGSASARQVFVATGSSSAGPFGWFQRRLAPVGSFIIVTEPLDAALLARLLPRQRNYVTSKHIGNYFRITPDQRLLFGGRARFAMSNPRSDAKSGRILHAAMTEVFPDLVATRIDYCWGGLVDITADRLPRAGEHDGLYYAMGFSGHGTQMSVRMGEVMSEVMNGNAAANMWALPWPAIPGHTGKPWFLPLVGAWYRFLDWAR
jgi:glycine/D-amino acid oxidase-like deaminating enzyme